MKTRHIAGLSFLGSLIAISLAGMLVTRLKTGPLPGETPKVQPSIPGQEHAGPGPRLMEQRKMEVIRLIQHWEASLEEEILDPGFYLDCERSSRKQEAEALLEQAGSLRSIGKLSTPRPLEGNFHLEMERGELFLSFTLDPEHPYRITKLELNYEAHHSDPL